MTEIHARSRLLRCGFPHLGHCAHEARHVKRSDRIIVQTDERVLQELLGRWSLLWILAQTLQDEISKVLRERLRQLGWRVVEDLREQHLCLSGGGARHTGLAVVEGSGDGLQWR